MFQQLFELALDGLQVGQQPGAIVMVVLVAAPRGEDLAGEPQAVFAEGLLVGQAFAVAAEVALQL